MRTEVADEVGLVAIAALERERRPADFGGPIDSDDGLAEAVQPLVGLRGQADLGAEDLLEPAQREPKRLSQFGDSAALRLVRDPGGGECGRRMGATVEIPQPRRENLLERIELASAPRAASTRSTSSDATGPHNSPRGTRRSRSSSSRTPSSAAASPVLSAAP